jgi:hypothetical protein
MTLNAVYKNLALLNVERLYLKDNNHKKAQEIANQIKDTTACNPNSFFTHFLLCIYLTCIKINF